MTVFNVVHLPTPQEAEEAKITSRALSKYAHNERLHIKIAGNDNLKFPKNSSGHHA